MWWLWWRTIFGYNEAKSSLAWNLKPFLELIVRLNIDDRSVMNNNDIDQDFQEGIANVCVSCISVQVPSLFEAGLAGIILTHSKILIEMEAAAAIQKDYFTREMDLTGQSMTKWLQQLATIKGIPRDVNLVFHADIDHDKIKLDMIWYAKNMKGTRFKTFCHRCNYLLRCSLFFLNRCFPEIAEIAFVVGGMNS